MCCCSLVRFAFDSKPTRALNKSAHSHRYLQDLPAGLSTFNDTCLAQQHGHQTVLQNVEHVKRIVQVCARHFRLLSCSTWVMCCLHSVHSA